MQNKLVLNIKKQEVYPPTHTHKLWSCEQHVGSIHKGLIFFQGGDYWIWLEYGANIFHIPDLLSAFQFSFSFVYCPLIFQFDYKLFSFLFNFPVDFSKSRDHFFTPILPFFFLFHPCQFSLSFFRFICIRLFVL